MSLNPAIQWCSQYSGFHVLCSCFCLKKKNRSPVWFSSNVQDSSVMVSFIPDCMNEMFSSNNNWCFEHPALFAMLFRVVWVEKWGQKVCKGKQDPVEDCCWIWCLILHRPSKIKSNTENKVFRKNGVKTCPEDELSPSCERARKSVSTIAKILWGAKFRLFYSRSFLKKQSATTKEHFSSSKGPVTLYQNRTILHWRIPSHRLHHGHTCFGSASW